MKMLLVDRVLASDRTANKGEQVSAITLRIPMVGIFSCKHCLLLLTATIAHRHLADLAQLLQAAKGLRSPGISREAEKALHAAMQLYVLRTKAEVQESAV
jgi:hypothetical protein